jgi:uncharacterized membrane protein YfcA
MTTMTYRHEPAVASAEATASAGPAVADGSASASPANPRLGALLLIGVLGGVLSGLFAIGGGILMIPLLAWRARMDQRRAAATSLVAIVPTAVVSSAAYLLHGEIDVVAGALVAVGAVAGAVIGSRLLRRLPVTWLRWAFIVFLLTIAVRLLLVTPGRGHSIPLSPVVVLGYLALGMIMGIASGLFGIGGGIIAVPLLVSVFAVGELVAKGTALLVSIPTSLVATTSNRRHGLLQAADIRAGLIVGTAAALASIPAVELAVAIPARASGILFAGLLLAIATQLAVKAVRSAHPAA